MNHITLNELKEKEDYYNKYVLSNPLLPMRMIRHSGLMQHMNSLIYTDKRHQNGILENNNLYVLNKDLEAKEEHFKG